MQKSTKNRLLEKKLKNMLETWPNGIVLISAGLSRHGFYKQLIKRYCDSGWLKKVGHGAYTKIGDQVEWSGALYALVNELSFPVHVGALTALELEGLAHTIPVNLNQQSIFIVNTSGLNKPLPKWFYQAYQKSVNFIYIQRHLFKAGIENQAFFYKTLKGVEIKIASSERAILESLALVPQQLSYEEATHLIENLQTLRPDLMQSLLANCLSVKVVRLFLHLAEKYNLPCFKYIDIKKINLGKGKRVIGTGGIFDKKYGLSVPKLLESENLSGTGYV